MKKNEIVSAAGEMGSEAVQPAAKRHDWLAKAVCLLLACVIWLYVMLVDSPDHEETFHSVDIELINTSILEDEHSLSVYSGYGNVVDVTVVGKKSDISRMSAEDIRITADVSQIGEAGTHTLTLSADLPAGLSLGALSQNSVQVYCDEKSSKVVNVRARLVSFVSEYSIGSLEPEYDTVVVSGPKETLDQIGYALVELDLGSISTSMTASGRLVLTDAGGTPIENPYLRMSRSDVKVHIPVYTVKTLPVTVGYRHGYFNADNVEITLHPAALAVRGDPSVLSKMDELVVATLDEKMIAGDVTQLVSVNLAEGLTVEDGTGEVLIDIVHKGTYTKAFNVTDIDVTGAVGIDYDILDRYLTVTVRGPLEQLAKLKATDFSVVVDLSGYTEQTSGVIEEIASVRIDASDALGVYEIGEYTVRVRLN